MPVVHLTAKMRPPYALFGEHEYAAWFWERVREGFSDVLAHCVMPNHPHVLADVKDPEAARDRFARTCGHLQRMAGVRDLWEPVPPAQVVVGRQKLLRSLRYVALNPPRAGLCGCPLEWLWSTHRELVGAVADRVVPPRRLEDVLGWTGPGFAEWFHRYGSSDPAVRVDGTAMPRPAPPRVIPTVPLDSIVRAAAVATRSRPAEVLHRGPARKLFIALARHQGWTDSALVGGACGLAPNGVRKAWRQDPPTALQAAALCLGDERLRDR